MQRPQLVPCFEIKARISASQKPHSAMLFIMLVRGQAPLQKCPTQRLGPGRGAPQLPVMFLINAIAQCKLRNYGIGRNQSQPAILFSHCAVSRLAK